MTEKIGLFCASSNNLDAAYYEEAERFGRWLGSNGKSLVYGGNNRGLMESTAKGVHESGGHVIGILPQIIVDRGTVSEYVDESVVCSDLNDRKQKLVEKSDIIVVMPGSIGTLDESFSVMASNSIGIHDKRLLFWNMNGFWNELFSFLESFNNKGVVNKPWEELYSVANSFEEVVKGLKG